MNGTNGFRVGDRVHHLAPSWYHVPPGALRSGTVLAVTQGVSHRGQRRPGGMWTTPVTKLLVQWDRIPGWRTNFTERSWVMADWCAPLPPELDGWEPEAPPADDLVRAADALWAAFQGSGYPLSDEQAEALVALAAAVDPWRNPPPVEPLRAEEV